MNTQVTVKPFPIVLTAIISLATQLFVPLFLNDQIALGAAASYVLSAILFAGAGVLYLRLARPATTQAAASGGAMLTFGVTATLALFQAFSQQTQLPASINTGDRAYVLFTSLALAALVIPVFTFINGLSTALLYRRTRRRQLANAN